MAGSFSRSGSRQRGQRHTRRGPAHRDLRLPRSARQTSHSITRTASSVTLSTPGGSGGAPKPAEPAPLTEIAAPPTPTPAPAGERVTSGGQRVIFPLGCATPRGRFPGSGPRATLTTSHSARPCSSRSTFASLSEANVTLDHADRVECDVVHTQRAPVARQSHPNPHPSPKIAAPPTPTPAGERATSGRRSDPLGVRRE